MFTPRTSQFFAIALAAGMALHPIQLASDRDARVTLPPAALVHALATHNPVLLALCLAERVSANASDAEGRTPLMVATMQRDTAMIGRLLGMGANVDLADAAGVTPLMLAAAEGDLQLVKILLGHSNCPEIADAAGRSAAHYALSARQYDCFRLLLSQEPETDVLAGGTQSLLNLAYASGDEPSVKAVVSQLPAGLDWNPQTLAILKRALAANDLEFTRLLLSKHAAMPTVERSSTPLLAQAIVEDDAPTFRALLAAGSDPNTILPVPCDKKFAAQIPAENLRSYVRGDKGITLLMLAAGLGRSEYIRALLAAGADRNRETARYKMLALYFAAQAREAQSVQLLLGRGPTREQLRVEISLATQKASVIKDGVAILNTSVSTGRKGFDTPAGEYVITDKNRNHISSLYHVEMPFFMRLNCLDFGMHAGHVPNYPASHGCIRVPAAMAEKLFSEIPVGTVVTIN